MTSAVGDALNKYLEENPRSAKVIAQKGLLAAEDEVLVLVDDGRAAGAADEPLIWRSVGFRHLPLSSNATTHGPSARPR